MDVKDAAYTNLFCLYNDIQLHAAICCCNMFILPLHSQLADKLEIYVFFFFERKYRNIEVHRDDDTGQKPRKEAARRKINETLVMFN